MGDLKHGKNWLIYYNLITRHAEWPTAESLDVAIISMQGNNNVNDVQFCFCCFTMITELIIIMSFVRYDIHFLNFM